MTGFNQIERSRRTAIYIRISTSQQQTDRKPSNLLKSIEYYQSKNVWLWFGKQQMWVCDKSDISTQIMISVLAVMSQYEIELLTARGMDGKISAIRSHGIHIGGFTPYGYSDNPMDHKLVVNPQVARVFKASILMLAARAAGL